MQVVEILPCGNQGPVYPAYVLTWLLVTWQCEEKNRASASNICNSVDINIWKMSLWPDSSSNVFPLFQVNLRHGIKDKVARTGHEKDTCTACAGTMILEFAALSRLTGITIFEVWD